MTDPAPQTLHTIARRARVRGVRASLLASLLLAGAAYALSGTVAAEGVMLGGIAGALGFWALSLRLERIATVRPDKLQVAATIWTFYRITIYAVFLFVAYRLDTRDSHGLLGGIAGLLSTRFAVTFLALRDSRAAHRSEASS